jgi:hypothetical protein
MWSITGAPLRRKVAEEESESAAPVLRLITNATERESNDAVDLPHLRPPAG